MGDFLIPPTQYYKKLMKPVIEKSKNSEILLGVGEMAKPLSLLLKDDKGVQPIIFCFGGVPPSGKSLPINLASALR